MIHKYREVGKYLAEYWGWKWAAPNKTLGDTLKSLSPEKLELCLGAASVDLLRQLVEANASLPARIAKANHAADMKLEKEKQKTAKAQQQAIESRPPIVTHVDLSTDEVERAIENHRVLRRF